MAEEQEILEVEVKAPAGALQVSVGRWGPFAVKDGKVRIPTDAVSDFVGDGYEIVKNSLGRTYEHQQEAKADLVAGPVPWADQVPVPPRGQEV